MAESIALGEARALDEPCRGNLLVGLKRGIAGQGPSAGGGALLQVLMLLFGEYRILEERACALAIVVAGDDEHAFDRADVAHGLAGLGQVGGILAAGEVMLEIGVGNVRLAAGTERVSHTKNNEPSALACIKDAGAIAESAGFAAEFANLVIAKIEDFE